MDATWLGCSFFRSSTFATGRLPQTYSIVSPCACRTLGSQLTMRDFFRALLCARLDARISVGTALVVSHRRHPISGCDLYSSTVCSRPLRRTVDPRPLPTPELWGVNSSPPPFVPTRAPQLRAVTVANYSDGVSTPPGDDRPTPR